MRYESSEVTTNKRKSTCHLFVSTNATHKSCHTFLLSLLYQSSIVDSTLYCCAMPIELKWFTMQQNGYLFHLCVIGPADAMMISKAHSYK